jgi:hypothetical protein
MPGLAPGIHVFAPASRKDVDNRDKSSEPSILSWRIKLPLAADVTVVKKNPRLP